MFWILVCIGLSILPAIFWFWFLIISKKGVKKTSFRLILELFLGGLALASIAMLVEIKLIKFLSVDYLSFLEQHPFITDFRGLGFIFILTFVIIAPLEEFLKYFFLKKEIHKKKEVDQAIKGVQLGIILGLGFATLENGFYFYQAASHQILGGLFISRFFLSTLAHVLYGGILGYYLALAKFHKLYSNFFLKKGLVAVILLHGFFNFSLLTQAFYYTIGVVLIIFFVLMKWMIDRRDFETFVARGESPVSVPLFAEKQEIDTFLAREKFSFSEIKALSFCPRCLAIKKIGQKTCPYCGMKFE